MVGYRVDPGMLKKFEVVVSGKSHLETRYDPITGSPHEVEVVDSNVHRYYEADGRRFDLGELDEEGGESDPGNYDVSVCELDEFCTYVAGKLGCEFLLCGESSTDDYFGYFCAHGTSETWVDLTGRISVRDPVSLGGSASLTLELGPKLMRFGIPVGEPVVAVGWLIQ